MTSVGSVPDVAEPGCVTISWTKTGLRRTISDQLMSIIGLSAERGNVVTQGTMIALCTHFRMSFNPILWGSGYIKNSGESSMLMHYSSKHTRRLYYITAEFGGLLSLKTGSICLIRTIVLVNRRIRGQIGDPSSSRCKLSICNTAGPEWGLQWLFLCRHSEVVIIQEFKRLKDLASHI